MDFCSPTSGGVEHFLPRERGSVNESLHRGLAVAPAALMRALFVVAGNPDIEVGLQLLDPAVDPLAERDLVELVEYRLVEALADAVGLRPKGLGPGVVDILDREVEFVFRGLRGATILGAAIRQHAGQLDLMVVLP